MKRVGITGGIGSGKSVVCQVFKLLGIPVFDADSQAKEIVNSNEKVKLKIIKLLGAEAYSETGYNRTYVASRVFNNQVLLKTLNQIIHPAVGKEFDQWLLQQESNYILKEAALLFESDSYRKLDEIVVVSSPLHLRLERIQKRDPHRSRSEILSIIENQMPDEEKIERASYVIFNGPEDMIIPQVLALHHSLNKPS